MIIKLIISSFLFLIISFFNINYIIDNKGYVTENKQYYSKNYFIDYQVLKDEYILSSVNENNIGITETIDKEMITTIFTNENYYRYKVIVVWKNIPSVRSYDIIGIGFFNNLKLKSGITFKQEYCYLNGICSSDTKNFPQIFDNGVGTMFKLPDGDLYSLKQTLYFDVEKNTDEIIFNQDIYGDYSHAIETIPFSKARGYKVVLSSGIICNHNIANYYDSINVAKASWSGSW